MKTLAEKEAENFLEKSGFDVVKRVYVKNKKDLSSVKIKFPWVMKASSKSIIHKAKLGAIIMDIDSYQKADQAFENLSKIDGFEESVVQEKILGNEVIIGMKKTPEFSNVIMFGKGGSNVEKEKDVSFRVLPITVNDIKEMITETKVYNELLKNGANIKKLEDIILKLSKLAIKKKDISELDINPLIVNSKDAEIVDARIMFD